MSAAYQYRGSTCTIDEYLERNDIAALLVIADGAVVHEQYRLGTNPGTR